MSEEGGDASPMHSVASIGSNRHQENDDDVIKEKLVAAQEKGLAEGKSDEKSRIASAARCCSFRILSPNVVSRICTNIQDFPAAVQVTTHRLTGTSSFTREKFSLLPEE
ncbi:hypothetical protein PsorP6_012108 [Peronosclerospora sorghi]|uniref:Uncharacterized protein n=1 Tax=Peronosclerospora sorghi TaxID=230839 RepID=A0ACC0WM92_9STRA|nr:hypothetical protein PsorP6_012108 [Peronosclerospora sorghi]